MSFAGTDWFRAGDQRRALVRRWLTSAGEAFLAQLLILEGVPLTYLVPDEGLLPAESLRVFHVDPAWTARLVDGALAAGRATTRDWTTDPPLDDAVTLALDALLFARTGEHLPTDPADARSDTPVQVRRTPITGVLLRSDLVRRWPTIEIAGYDAPRYDDGALAGLPRDTFASLPSLDFLRLPVLRRAQLSTDVLLVLFAGRLVRLVLVEPPETTRLGVEPVGDQVRPISTPPGDNRTFGVRGPNVLDLEGYFRDGTGSADVAAALMGRRYEKTYNVRGEP